MLAMYNAVFMHDSEDYNDDDNIWAYCSAFCIDVRFVDIHQFIFSIVNSKNNKIENAETLHIYTLKKCK